MAFRIAIKTPKFPRSLQPGVAQGIVQTESLRAVNESLLVTRRAMVEASPVALGVLRNSWTNSPAKATLTGVEGKTFSGSIVALVVDEGAKPHTPPVDPLKLWVRRKIGLSDEKKIATAAFGIQAAIKVRGIPAKGSFTTAWKNVRPVIESAMANMTTRIVNRLERGR